MTDVSCCLQVRRHNQAHRVYASGPPGTESFHYQLQQQRATIEGQSCELARLRRELAAVKRCAGNKTRLCSSSSCSNAKHSLVRAYPARRSTMQTMLGLMMARCII